MIKNAINKYISSLLFIPCFAASSVIAGLPFVEDFIDTKGMDADVTTAAWHTGEHSLMLGFQKTQWQSANRPWVRRILDERGNDTRAIAVGDFNNDGYTDIVSANYGDVNLLYFGGLDGTFGVGVPLGSHGGDTQAIGLGDLNGDACTDIIEGNSNQSNYYYINNGDGTFQEPESFPGDVRDTRAVALGDINRDGWPDVVFANSGKASRCFYNNQGVFKEGVDIGEEPSTATAILIHDVNCDGRLDVVLGNWDHPLMLFLNDGNGFPLEGVAIAGSAMKVTALAAGDIENDGRQEIIAGNFASADRVYRMGPDSQWTFSDFSGDTTLTDDMALGDLDGNGFIDVVKAENSLSHHYYLNQGDGVFTYGTAFFDGTQNPNCVAIGDLDGNGLLDVIAGNTRAPNCIYFNQGCMRPFIGVRGTALEDSSRGTTSLAAGDINGDALPDIIAGVMNAGVRVYINRKESPFSEGILLEEDKRATTSVAIGDLNKDGYPDVVAGAMKQRNRYYLNNGNGTWSGHDISPDAHATTSVKIGDMNGDGFPDVVVGNMGLENQLFLNDGNGAFQIGMDITDDRFDTFCVALGDVNNDGRPDIVTGNYGDKNRLYINTGGAFPFFGSEAQNVSEDRANTLSLVLADMNGDGLADVVTGNYSHTNRVYLNNGTERPFEAVEGMEITADKDKTFSAACADLDADGDLDFVAGNAGEADKLYLNNGTATPFSDAMGIPLTEHSLETLCVCVDDLNNDRAPDILTGHRDNACLVYLNPGRPCRRYGLACLPEAASLSMDIPAPEVTNTDVIATAAGEYPAGELPACEAPHFSFTSCTAASPALNEPGQQITAVSVSLTTSMAPNTDIAFYLTNNGGDLWVGARDGQTVFFPSTGNHLAWRAAFHSLSSVHSAQIHKIGLTVPEFTVTYETDGTPGARCQGEAAQKVAAGAHAQPVTAIPPAGYRFARWMREDKHYSFENPVFVGDIGAATALTAVFAREINSLEDLRRIGNDPLFPLDGRYCLCHDLDASAEETSLCIGNPDNAFSGWLFGNHHHISGLSQSGARDVFNGLFCVLGEGGEVRDLFLPNVAITHSGSVTGTLAGRNDGMIENCHVTGRLVYDYYANLRGGLVGENGASGTISRSTAIAEVGCNGESVGGLAGRNSGLISDSFFRGRVWGEKSVGGITGCQEGGSLHHSGAVGVVTASTGNAGGLTGLANNAVISGCFASSEIVSRSGPAGGLIGHAWNTRVRECFSLSQVRVDEGPVAALTGIHHAGSVEACYVAGPVAGPIAAGLLNCPEEAVPEVVNTYWDRESTGQNLACAPGIELGGAHEKMTVEMVNPDTYMSWNFSPEDTFGIVSGKTYPFLRWNPPDAAIACVKGGEAEAACFDIFFSLPVPGFDRDDLVVSCEGVTPLDVTLTPENKRFPSLWHAKVIVDGPLGRVNAAAVLPDGVASDMASSTVFSGAPSMLALETTGPDSITCTWKDNGNLEEGFLLHLWKGESTAEMVVRIDPDTVRYTVEGLQPGTKHFLEVSAISGAYESERTDAVAAWTQAYPPLKPALAAPAENAIDISITPGDHNSAWTEYALRISPAADGKNWIQPGGGRGGVPSWNNANAWATTRIPGLESATRYTFVAVARNGAAELSEESPGESIFTHCELNYIASVNGSVTGGRQTIAYGQDGLLVTAKPYPGYRFLQWSDGSRENPRQDKTVTGNINIEAQFGPLFGGIGTAEAPYEITDVETLQGMGSYLDKHFVLKNDVDASSTSAWNDGSGFKPIGAVTAPFTGTFSGNNFVISGLTVERRTEKNAGLFGVIGSGAQLKQVVLEKARINARENAGALVGFNNGGKISECLVTGEVSGGVSIGGLLGYGEAGTLDLCRAESSVKGIDNVGGLAGFSSNIAFSRCYALCTVEGSQNIGGFGGYTFKSILTNCYSRSSVTGTGYAGGLMGYNHTGTIQFCYAAGNVSCPTYSGGLLGFNDKGTLAAAYWDTIVTKQAASHGSDPSFGKTTAEMYVAGTFKNWDFESVWTIRENVDYPALRANPGNAGT